MGAIETTELSNGNIGLEITYGGKEAPFGGVDSSAPPAYINPRCFTECDGFIVVDNQLVAVSLNPVQIPTLWSGTAGVILIGFGNFYNTTYGTLNYALGYTAVAVAGTPTGVAYTFYMTSWNPVNIAGPYNDTLSYTLFNSITPAVAASITIQLASTSTSNPGSGAAVNITAITSLSGDGNTYGGAGVFIPGIISSLTVSGGSNYVVGSTYWVVQGSIVTAQVTITAIGINGSITGFNLVPNTFSTIITNNSNQAVEVSTAGWGYSVGSAAIQYAQVSNVQLQISSPSDSNTYTVADLGVTSEVVNGTGTGAVLAVSSICQSGGYTNIRFYRGSDVFSNAAIVALAWPQNLIQSAAQGNGYNVGDLYRLQSAYYTDDASSGWAFSTVNTVDPNMYLRVTGVGAGGSLVSWELMSTGYEDSTIYNAGQNGIDYVVGLGSPVGINTISTGPAFILNTMAAEINGTLAAPYNVANLDVSATVNVAASTLTLTAIVPGAVGNSISVQDFSQISGPDLYYYYFTVRSRTFLTGGANLPGTGTTLSTTLPAQASIVAVGGTLYIANIGPAIIKYVNPGQFVTSTTAQGVRVLRKFAGSLIGLGNIPAPNPAVGFPTTALDMIFSWSATLDLDIWNVLGLNGNVTGAGFAQLADIGDYLTGLIVTNATAFIIRSQGISYATATGNATSPFNFNHIGLGDEGEGAQVTALLAQYDQSGLYVGNSDVYQLANGITAVGAKINKALFNTLGENSFRLFGNAACAVMLTSETVLFLLAIGNVIYIYNPSNATWQTITLLVSAENLYSLALGVFASSNTTASSNLFNQCSPIVAVERSPQVYQFYELSEGVPNGSSLSLPPSVTFPSEEISFGRDVTVDGIYSAISAQVSENVSMIYNLNGNEFSIQSLTPSEFNSLGTLPVGTQVFPDSTASSGAVTEHSPQLQISIAALPDTGTALVRITKQAIFGSFDPRQRPV
jgi:hypothetical protein